MRRTEFCQGNNCICQSHFAHGAGDVYCYGAVGLREDQFVSQESVDEFCRFVELHLLNGFAHAMQAGALIAEDRVFALLAGFPKGGFEFCGFAIGNVEHTFTFPDGATTELIYVLGEDDFVTAFLQEGDHLVYQRLLHGGFFRESHGLVDAAGEINYFVSCGVTSYRATSYQCCAIILHSTRSL